MSFDNYFDDHGLLVNMADGRPDGGDTAQMTGLYRFGQWLKAKREKDKETLARIQGRFAQECEMLTYVELVKNKQNDVIDHKPHPGVFVRNPGPGYPAWAANPHTFSRDQQRSLVVAMGALKQKKQLWLTLKRHVARLGWYQNDQEIDGSKKTADFAAPDILGEYIRAFWMASGPVGRVLGLLAYPVVLLTDVSAFVGMLLNFINWRNPNDVDDDNAYMTMLQAKHALPTPLSWLARKIYKHLRPGGPLHAMEWKHRSETGSPPFFELYKETLEKEL